MNTAPTWLTYLNSLLALIGPFVGAALAHWYAAFKAGKTRDERIRAAITGFGDAMTGDPAAEADFEARIRFIVSDELAHRASSIRSGGGAP